MYGCTDSIGKKHNILYCIVDDTKLITPKTVWNAWLVKWLLQLADIFRKILSNVGTKVVGKCFFRCDFIERNFLEWEWTNKKALRDNISLLCVSSSCYLLTLDVDVGGRILFLSSFLLHLGEVVGEGAKARRDKLIKKPEHKTNICQISEKTKQF